MLTRLLLVAAAVMNGAWGAPLDVNQIGDVDLFIDSLILPRPCSELPPFTSLVPHFKYLNEMLNAPQGFPPTHALEEYLRFLQPYIECTPPPPKVTVRPSNITVDCFGKYWNGPRDKPKHIVDIFPFAHELDVLEMRLYELDAVVDEFVIFESVFTHRLWKRPLFFERNKARYRQFLHKMHHIISDDSTLKREYKNNNNKQKEGEDWRGEHIMRWYPWQAFKKMVASDAAMDEMLFLHSDADEIPSAEAIAHFKYCIPKPEMTPPVGLMNYMYRLNFDWYLWPDNNPSVFEAKHVAQKFNNHLVHGGTLSTFYDVDAHYGYTVNRFSTAYGDLFKDLALAEGGYVPRLQEMGRQILMDPTVTDQWRSKGVRSCCEGDSKVVKPRPANARMPWFAVHNKHRFRHLFPNECANNAPECQP